MELCTKIRENQCEFPTASPQLVLHEVLRRRGKGETGWAGWVSTHEISYMLVPFEFGSDPGDGLFSRDRVGNDWMGCMRERESIE